MLLNFAKASRLLGVMDNPLPQGDGILNKIRQSMLIEVEALIIGTGKCIGNIIGMVLGPKYWSKTDIGGDG